MAPFSSRQPGPLSPRGQTRGSRRGGSLPDLPLLRERVSFCVNRPGARGPCFVSGYPGAPGAAACPKAQEGFTLGSGALEGQGPGAPTHLAQKFRRTEERAEEGT